MYQGVKDLIASYREPFNKAAVAKKKARERLREKDISTSSKAGKQALEDEIQLVLEEWEQKAQWGTDAHKKLQDEGMKKYPSAILGTYIKTEGNIIPKMVLDINKITPNTRYFEKQIIDPQNNIIGFVDEVYIDKKWNIHITEYKSSNNLNRSFTFMTPKGPILNYYFPPIEEVIDCNFNHAALQASFYMYMLWYYNKKLKPGTITIKHIKLNEDDGSIESVVNHNAPYMLEEVKLLIKDKKKK